MSLLSNFGRVDEILVMFCWLLSLPVPLDELALALHANLPTKPAWLRFSEKYGTRMEGQDLEEVVIRGGVREREAMAWLVWVRDRIAGAPAFL